MEAVEVNFDGITYAKGASVIKQLVAYVGIDAFVAGLRDYFGKHAWGNATFGDLLDVAGGGVRHARCATSPPSGWRRPRSTRCARRSRSADDGTYAVGRRPPGGTGRATRRCVPTASASACTT